MDHETVQGINVPKLGFGTWRLEGDECRQAVKTALDIGYRHIDTAQIYMNEEYVGRGIRDGQVARQDIFLVTKVWRDRFHADDLRRSLDESLEKLQTDYVDLLLLHWPVPEVPLKETLSALTAVQKEGKTRLVGVSNFPVALMRESLEVLGAPISFNQVEYHPFLSQRAVLDYARANGIAVTAYSPLARGDVTRDQAILAIAEKYGKSPAQIALRWLCQQEGVFAIPKASSEKHARANFEIFDFTLTGEEMSALHALASPAGRLINPAWAPEWDPA